MGAGDLDWIDLEFAAAGGRQHWGLPKTETRLDLLLDYANKLLDGVKLYEIKPTLHQCELMAKQIDEQNWHDCQHNICRYQIPILLELPKKVIDRQVSFLLHCATKAFQPRNFPLARFG